MKNNSEYDTAEIISVRAMGSMAALPHWVWKGHITATNNSAMACAVRYATAMGRVRRLHTSSGTMSAKGFIHVSNRLGDAARCMEKNTRKAIMQPINPVMP